MADERDGYGTIGTGGGSDPNVRPAQGSTQDSTARTGFGRTEDVSTRSGLGAGDVGSERSFGTSAGSGFDDSADLGTRTGFEATDDAGTRAGSYDRKFTDESSGEGNRVERAVNSGRGRIADQLQRVGDRIEERARHLDDAGGVQRKAGRVALRAGEALDSGADYIRTHEVNEMREDLEDAIRERPLLSVGIALGAGFLLARLMRD